MRDVLLTVALALQAIFTLDVTLRLRVLERRNREQNRQGT